MSRAQRDPAPPRWLKPMNQVFIVLQRLGLGPSGMYTLTLRGRKSGKPRTTPLSVVTLDGQRYLMGGFPDADWVANARAAGGGLLIHARQRERVWLRELPAEEARPILRIWPIEVPTSIEFMTGSGLVKNGTPEEFEALAGRCPVFRIEPVG